MWSAIVNGMTAVFSALHNFIVSLGIPENKEGLTYVLAIFIFTLIIMMVYKYLMQQVYQVLLKLH